MAPQEEVSLAAYGFDLLNFSRVCPYIDGYAGNAGWVNIVEI